MGLEPQRLVALAVGRTVSLLIVSAFFMSDKMNKADTGCVGRRERSAADSRRQDRCEIVVISENGSELTRKME